MHKICFTISLFHNSTCFEHHVLIVRRSKLYYTNSGIITPNRCDDTRGCIIQFFPPDDEHMCSKHVEAWNKLIIKFSASSWLILRNKYIEMHGQQNIKKKIVIYLYVYTHDNIKWAKCNQFRGITHQSATQPRHFLISWQTSRAVSVK